MITKTKLTINKTKLPTQIDDSDATEEDEDDKPNTTDKRKETREQTVNEVTMQ